MDALGDAETLADVIFIHLIYTTTRVRTHTVSATYRNFLLDDSESV